MAVCRSEYRVRDGFICRAQGVRFSSLRRSLSVAKAALRCRAQIPRVGQTLSRSKRGVCYLFRIQGTLGATPRISTKVVRCDKVSVSCSDPSPKMIATCDAMHRAGCKSPSRITVTESSSPGGETIPTKWPCGVQFPSSLPLRSTTVVQSPDKRPDRVRFPA